MTKLANPGPSRAPKQNYFASVVSGLGARLENALEEIKSGEGLSTFVEGHGLQSRRFRFEWHEPSLDISFELPTGRVLSDYPIRPIRLPYSTYSNVLKE